MRWIRSNIVEQVYNRTIDELTNTLLIPDNAHLQHSFGSFHSALRNLIHDRLTPKNTIHLLAQHILARPVFDDFFSNINFINNNPVAMEFNKFQEEWLQYSLENEIRDLERFYESVRSRMSLCNNSTDRQQLLVELYENFFIIILNQNSDRDSILFTPVEITDFILNSVNEILQDEFGNSITEQGVHVLDPFTGAGTFLVRLINSEFIQSDDLERKYLEELHANDNSLITYYLAAASIEDAYRTRQTTDNSPEQFNGIILTDTFNQNISEDTTLFSREWFTNNRDRAETQEQLPISIIIGNTPWSIKHDRNITNISRSPQYSQVEQRIRETYVQNTTSRLTASLYDTYNMAFRWASDRIREKGIIAFVSNNSWIDSRIGEGIRACFELEFSSIYVLNLRGNARLSGDQGRREGGNVFGNRLRSPVAITILVKNSDVTNDDCSIYYKDIGDNLTREQKLETLRNAESISGIDNWQTIIPDRYNDWIQQRSEIFNQFYSIGSRATRTEPTEEAIFNSFSRGLITSRNTSVYNFSHYLCAYNALRMTQEYNAAVFDLGVNPRLNIEEVTRRYQQYIRWDRNLENSLSRRLTVDFDENNIRKVAYRPFVKMNSYVDNIFVQRRYQMARIFPSPSSHNHVICLPSIVSRHPFSILMTDSIPDMFFNDMCQCFPRYQYSENADTPSSIRSFLNTDDSLYRIDNITDTALDAFCRHYNTSNITKDKIFYYVYGILHSPNYREQFAYDLTRVLPRIPFAPDFNAFADAGMRLAVLHINYETCQPYPLETLSIQGETLQARDFRLGTRTMRYGNQDRTSLNINEHTCLSGIPEDTHRYKVYGRTPLEWFINQYRITQDRISGITNNPNDWFQDTREIVTAIQRIVYVSVESARIIDNLPTEITD